jgi:hypothetical protein
MLKRTVRHTLVAAGLFAVAGITASTAAGVALTRHDAAIASPVQALPASLPTVSGDLGEVVVYAPGELAEVVVHAARGPGDVRAATRAPQGERYLATVIVSVPRGAASLDGVLGAL